MIDLNSKASYLFFLLAFPGYFFFHVLKSTVPVPYIGWFSAVLIVCVAYWVVRSTLDLALHKICISSLFVTAPFFLLVIYLIISIAVNYLINPAPYVTLDASLSNLMVVVWTVALFFIGRHIDISRSTLASALAGILTLAFALCSLYFFDPSASSLVMPLLPGDESESANYQGMARSVMCFAIVLFPFIRSLLYRCVLMFITVASLYVIGSRTELALFIVTIPLFALIHYRLKGVFILMVGAVLGCFSLLYHDIDIFEKIEMYTSFDASLNERAILLKSGIGGIEASPILGDYLGQLRDFGGVGSYIHNGLSMWRQYGILAFAVYIYMMIISLVVGFGSMRKVNVSPAEEVLIYLSVACLLGVLTTKSIFWPIPALAWGVAANVLSQSSAKKKLSRSLERCCSLVR